MVDLETRKAARALQSPARKANLYESNSLMNEIDSRAIVSPSAKFGADVTVGAYAVVGDEVELGDGCMPRSPRGGEGSREVSAKKITSIPSPWSAAIRRTSPTTASAFPRNRRRK